MTPAFKQGFMDKIAEAKLGDLSLSFRTPFMGGHPPATAGMRSLTSASADKDISVDVPEDIKFETVRKPGWFERNQWIFKPLINALNIRHGSGTPVTGFQFKF